MNRTLAATVGVLGLGFTVLLALSRTSDAAQKPLGGNAYPIEVCVVTGQPLDMMGEPVEYEHEGRIVKFCCKGCLPKFKADPQTYLAKIDAAVIEKQREHYPLDSCPISGQKLGAMGKAVDHVHGNRLVRLCCKGCVGRFEADAKKQIEKLNEAVVKAQLPDYPLDVCPVSGQKLGAMGEPVHYIHNNRLVQLCCKGCVKSFEKDPGKYLSKLEGDTNKAMEHAEGGHTGHRHGD